MQASAEKIWTSAQDFLRSMLNNGEIYNLWFAPLRANCIEGDLITLDVANEFSELWLKDNYLDLLRNVVSRAANRPMQVVFRVTTSDGGSRASEAPVVEKPPAKESASGSDRHGALHPGAGRVQRRQLQHHPGDSRYAERDQRQSGAGAARAPRDPRRRQGQLVTSTPG